MIKSLAGAFFTVAALLLAAGTGAAQVTYETVHSFVQAPGHPVGQLLEANDGRIYGVASDGGTFRGGSIFRLQQNPTGGWTMETLRELRPSDGTGPLAGLAQGLDGALYGTTTQGGAFGGGTVFRMTLAGVFQVLHSFNPGVHGVEPIFSPLVIGADGAFYGTALAGGAFGFGTVFRVTPAGAFSVLRAFSGPDGRYPMSGLTIGADGHFYGTTYAGGDLNTGTVFRITRFGVYTRLFSFAASGTMRFPQGRLALAGDGNLYGVATGTSVTSCGLDCVIFGNGAVFRVTPSGTVTDVGGFGAVGEFNNALHPAGGLTRASDGFLYGLGTSLDVFRVDPAAGRVVTLPGGTNLPLGGHPYSGLIQGGDGRLYGAAYADGGPGDQGSVFSFEPAAEPQLELVHTFQSAPYNPTGKLLLSADGALYGTAYNGGALSYCGYTGCGSVFRLAGNVVSTVTNAAINTNVGHLIGDLTESSAGTLYVASETTSFEIDKTGAFVRYLFASGQSMSHAPIQTADGSVYGVVGQGIYRRDPDFSFPLHSFSGPDGWAPYGALIEGADGALYGTTREGGASDMGTVFRLTPDGSFTTLHHFSSADGAYPLGTLVEGEDGLLYGTTLGGGAGSGTVFRIARDGTSFATLHAFSGADGAFPVAGLTRGSGGTFVGTAIAGGQGTGVVFAITSEGAFAVVHAFAPGQGATPMGGVTIMPDGSLYGTTVNGGAGSAGVIYRLTVQTPGAQ